jgi:hypothetical protein
MRLVVDYFTYAARPVASACDAACRMTHRRLLRLAQARRQLLRLRRASGCLGTSRGSSHGSSSTTSTTPRIRVPRHVARLVTWLVVDYFTYAARPGATPRRLLRLRRASGFLGTSRGSSSTTLPTPCVRVPCTSRGSSRGSSSTTPCDVTSSCGYTSSTSAAPCVATTCLAATPALLRVRRVPPRRCLPVTSCRPLISTSFPH